MDAAPASLPPDRALKGSPRDAIARTMGESMKVSSGRLTAAMRGLARPVLVLGALLLAHAPAAAAGWSAFHQASLKGALFSGAGGEAVFLLACDAPNDALLQANVPEGAKLKPGRSGSLSFSVDGRRFTYSGKVLETDDGKGQVLMASAKVSDPLVKALAKGSALTIAKGRAAYDVPLDGAGPAIAAFLSACGGKPAAPSAEAARETRTAAAEAPAHSSGTVPAASQLAAAIFVDKAEGQRVAGKLKIAPVDLNGDGTDEAIVTVKDPAWCGENGCTIFVVDFSGGTAHTIGDFIGLGLDPAKSSTGGWRDLTLRGPGGTELESYIDGTYR